MSALATFALASSISSAVTLSEAEAGRIGRKIWQNECGGTISGLTSWNDGENFASLGIGHFIWYPKGQRSPFAESFPKFAHFAAAHGARLPGVIEHHGAEGCPWNSQTEFLRSAKSAEMTALREFLAKTIDLQARFMVQRLQEALPKMLEETPVATRSKIQQKFEKVANTAQGMYALVDYVNFKGEGTLATERYRGEGWGLLQVLEKMPETSGHSAAKDFAQSAKIVLNRRVHNSPPERKEERWLPGWLNRINTYTSD
ncbi:MAG: hypothetical protein ABJB22_03585 [Verrucomicrobiota bacterium]